MDAARDGLNEARLADDGDEVVVESVVDCSTTPRCRHSASTSSDSDYVIAEPRSSSCSPLADDGLTENVDDADPAYLCSSVARVTDGIEATTTTTTSVPLLEQLVSSPCDVGTPVPATSAMATSSSLAAASDADGQISLNKSFLQKLESFVSSVGQVATAAPLMSWIRRPVFPSQSATGSVAVAARGPGPAEICQFSVSTFLPSPSTTETCWPLDLSAKRMESPASVDNTRSFQHRRVDLMQRGPGHVGVEGGFVDTTEVKPNAANSLACLERDFGEHSAIFTRLGSSHDRQRQAVAAVTTRGGRRGRNAAMPALMPAAHILAGARSCPPGTITEPHAELHPQRSSISSSQPPLTSGRTGIVGSKLDTRHPMTSMTTAAAVLRCLQCGRTFFSLPELTLHMIQSAHYANLICAAAAYGVEDEEDCVVVDAYNNRETSNAGVDHSTHRSQALQLRRGKDLTEVADAHRADRRYGNGCDVRRRDCLDAAVSPARSLDDESVSSAGLTETESLRSPTSTGSPTSPSRENVGSGASDDDLTLMSHLLRLQPLLSRTVLDNAQTGAAVPGHVDWAAVGLTAVEERQRQLVRGRSSKISMRELDRTSAADSLPIDMRSQRADGHRYRDSESRQMYLSAPAKIPALTSRSSSTMYLEKLLDDVRGYRKSLSSGIKRPSSSKWYNGKKRSKKHRSYITSSSDCDQTRYDRPRLNGDRSVIVSIAAPISGELCLRKRDDGIHGCRETASGVKLSPPTNHEHYSMRRQETGDGTRRSTSKDAAVQPVVIDGVAANAPALSVSGRDVDVPTAAGRGIRRSSVEKDQSEYAARFGKYYRLAQELSSKSD